MTGNNGEHMPNDFITITNIVGELNQLLKGGKIEKITQPYATDIVLSIYAPSGRHQLLLSASATTPNIRITNKKFISPTVAPAFTMHLRKNLVGSRIEGIRTIGEDRIIALDLCGRNELKDIINHTLILEIMSRYSNIILIKENDIISDALKRFSIDGSNNRVFMPGIKYSLPPNNKIKILNYEKIRNLLYDATIDECYNIFKSKVSGAASSTIEYLLNNASQHNDKVNVDTVINKIKRLLLSYRDNSAVVCYDCNIVNNCNNIVDFSVINYNPDNINAEYVGSINRATDIYFTHKIDSANYINRKNQLTAAIKKIINKTEKKLNNIDEKLIETLETDKYKLYGDLIINNIYLIKNNPPKVSLTDYESGNIIDIPLNIKYSPSYNAKLYYNRYNKLKRTSIQSQEQRQLCLNELNYYKSIELSLASATTLLDFMDIEKELMLIGAIKELPNKNKHSGKLKANKQPAKSIKYTPTLNRYNYKNYIIYVGKNNLQNDYLTFTLANSNDIWLHVKNLHGSHVLIKNDNNEIIADDCIQCAAELAVFYSQAKNSDKIEVDYTEKKNVKRHPTGNSGQVIYVKYKTILANSSEHADIMVK